MKLYLNTIITQAYHISRCSSWKLSSKARIAWAFIILLRIQQGEKQKRCHPKSDFRLWQAAHFSTKNSINKPPMNNRRLLIAAVFYFVHPVEKDSLKHHKLTQNSVSFGCQSKQVARCGINFPHELTCEILTNHSIKIDVKRWPTRDYGEKSEKHLSSPLKFLNNWLNFRVRGQFEMLIVLGHSYPGFQRLFMRGFRFRSSLKKWPSRVFGIWRTKRSSPSHARKNLWYPG